MSALKEFGDTAKALSKNPLGIIALFIVLIYGLAALVVGLSSQLGPEERRPIVWFLAIFPFIVLAVCGWLVSRHYEKLYAPRDFNSDEAFLSALQNKEEGRPGLKELDNKIKEKIENVLIADNLFADMENKVELQEKLKYAADAITHEIRGASFIKIDASGLTGSIKDVFEFPEIAFSRFSDLTDEIYFSIRRHVGPYEYGHSWVIRDPSDGHIIKHVRMILDVRAGVPLIDKRSLSEVGIRAGMILEVIKPLNA